MLSFAHAGARMVDQNNFYVLPSFLKGMWVDPIAAQVNELKKIHTSLGPKDLIVLWAGSNDYLLFPGRKSLDENLSAMRAFILSLQEMGAQNFIVLNVPDVSRSPFHGLGIGRALMEPDGINFWVKAHNKALETMIQKLKQESPQLQFATVDMHTAFAEILDHPSEFGFTEIDYPCVGGQLLPRGLPFQPFDLSGLPRFICQNPEETFFWDPWHPTTHAHCLATASLLDSLANQGWVKGYDKDQAFSACL
jgi:phospholipase/lecithinase/hemolysin